MALMVPTVEVVVKALELPGVFLECGGQSA
jgi:hypothetical protein